MNKEFKKKPYCRHRQQRHCKPTEIESLQDYLKDSQLPLIHRQERLHNYINMNKRLKKSHTVRGKPQCKDEQINPLAEQFSSMKSIPWQLVKGLSETEPTAS